MGNQVSFVIKLLKSQIVLVVINPTVVMTNSKEDKLSTQNQARNRTKVLQKMPWTLPIRKKTAVMFQKREIATASLTVQAQVFRASKVERITLY